jgi:hypothetical protein
VRVLLVSATAATLAAGPRLRDHTATAPNGVKVHYVIGHFIKLEKPQELIAAVASVLASVVSSRRPGRMSAPAVNVPGLARRLEPVS